MPNTFGHLFRITTYGESHGGGVGVVIDGCPPRIPITAEIIQKELDRRRPGQSKIVTPRKESDRCVIFSGLFEGLTTGTPIAIHVPNEDARPEAYREMETAFRPSHADYTYQEKYGIRNWQGGGRASARETIGRVAGGAVAKEVFLKHFPKTRVVAYVEQVHTIQAKDIIPEEVLSEEVEGNIVRWPRSDQAQQVIELIEKVRSEGDSIGGVVACSITGVPLGLGEPVFDKLEADLAKAMLSLPASKGFEIGSGFKGTQLRGSEHNDQFYIKNNTVLTRTNFSGGIQGGITNAQPIFFRVAFKPVATIALPQETITTDHQPTILKARGRHDPCVLPRAVPMVEAMVWLTLTDHLLRQKVLR